MLAQLGADAGRLDVYQCGHTHLQRTPRLPDGTLVVNPGSMGWPAYFDDEPFPYVVEAGRPQARHTLLRSTGAGWVGHAAPARLRRDGGLPASLG